MSADSLQIMGSAIGFILSLALTDAWVGFGPLLQFGDDWLLIISTFTGLIGFIDRFVLRNLYHREEITVAAQSNLSRPPIAAC